MKKRRLPAFDLKEILDLVMLGTIADVVPLISENRVFVSKGLQRLFSTSRTGLKLLINKVGLTEPVSSGDIGFKVIPPLNATGRLGQATDAVELLLCEDHQDCVRRISQLELQNQQRKEVGEKILLEAEALLSADGPVNQKPAIILGKKGWHSGVIGIVAAKLTQKYHRPSIVVAFDAEGNGKGSARSIPGIPLTQALQACSQYLTRHGGHDMAAGLSMDQDLFESFKENLTEYLQARHTEQDFQKKLQIDAEIPLSEVCLDFLESYEQLGPFGAGNPLPVFMCRGLNPTETPRLLKGLHLQISLMQGKSTARAIWFNAPLSELPPPPWDVAFHLTRNHFRGDTSAQMLIQDLRASFENPPPPT